MRAQTDRTTCSPLCRRVALSGLVAVLLTPLLLPVLLVSLPDRYQFEGQGWAHWILVRNTNAGRLGLIAPSHDAPVAYDIGFQEGTFPGWTIVSYQSTASPTGVHDSYRDRCTALGFRITASRLQEPGVTLVCEIEPYIDVELWAAQPPGAQHTDVRLRVWGR